jgi:adenylate kinase
VSRPLVLVFLGPPGSGKGTQSRILSETLAIPHLSTGETLREAVRSQSPLGEQVGRQMAAGSFVSDAVVAEIVAERIRAVDCQRGFILDGFPRTLPQAAILGAMLKRLGFPQPLVFNLGVDETRLEDRIIRRLTCPGCQEIYNSLSHGPRVSGHCDRCNAVLEARADDSKSVFQARIADFRRQTEPLASYYRECGSLIDVRGDGDIEAVGAEILASVNGLWTRSNGASGSSV